MMRYLVLFFGLITCQAAQPREALPLDPAEWPLHYRLHLEGAGKIRLAEGLTLTFDENGPHDIAVEHPAKGPPVLRVWNGGTLVRGPEEAPVLAAAAASDFPDIRLDLGTEFTAMAVFEAGGDGTLFSNMVPNITTSAHFPSAP